MRRRRDARRMHGRRVLCLLALTTLLAAPPAQAACVWAEDAPTSVGGDDTERLQHGIDACAQAGGGTLTLAPRTYVIGPVQLRSHVYLQLDPQTVIQASADRERFQPAFIGWPWRPGEALISGYRISDSGLRGGGTIDGRGALWWPRAQRERHDGTMARLFPDVPDANGMPRPWLVEFADCSEIRVEGVQLRNAMMWNLVIRDSRQVEIRHISILNPADSPNTDGIDIVSSQQVRIADVDIATGDDNITLKSGLPGEGGSGRPTADIDIRRVRLGSGHGVSIGSETAHGIWRVRMQELRFVGTDNGLRVKTGRDRGAEIHDLAVSDVQMQAVGTALSVSAYYPQVPAEREEPQPLTPLTPRIHDLRIERLRARGVQVAGRLIGLPESPLRGIRLRDVHIDARDGLTLRDVDLQSRGLRVRAARGPALLRQPGTRLR